MNEEWYGAATERRPTKKLFDPEDGIPVRAVVLHRTDEDYEEALRILADEEGGVSAHFLIGEEGQVTQFASLNERTWANGIRYNHDELRWYTVDGKVTTPSWTGISVGENPNRYTIAVEHSGFHDKPMTEAQEQASVKLLAWISNQLGFALVPGQTLIRHSEIDPVTRYFCPGPFVDIQALAGQANKLAANYFNQL